MKVNKYPEGYKARRVRPPTPLNLKRILLVAGVSQAEVRRAVRLADGTTPSESLISQIITRNIWPAQTQREYLQKQIEDYLRQRGVTDAELVTAWDMLDVTAPAAITPPRAPASGGPFKLRHILASLGVSQDQLRHAVQLVDGTVPSVSQMSRLINRDVWPAKTPREYLKQQIEEFLRAYSAKEEDIATAWELLDTTQLPTPHYHAPRRQPGRAPIADFEDQLPETAMLSQAARKHFHLFKDPFTDDVQGPEDVYLSADQRYIREAMFQTAKHGGFMAVIGESGAGKTTLRRDLIDRIQREGHPVTVIQPRIIDKGGLTAGSICDAIIQDISQERPKISLESKARQIERLLVGSSRAGNHHVLIIEEAHDLTIKTIKLLKRFWELEDGFRKLLSIILIGQPELKAKLDERQNWDAREVIRRCEIAELMPLNGNLEEYVALKFKRIGKDITEVFTPDAFDAIRARLTLRRRGTEQTTSMHYPLVVNNLIIRALNLAAEIGEPKVTGEIVRGV